MSLWKEIKRRKVVRVAVAYAVVAWLLVEIVVTVEEPLSLPGWLGTVVIVLLLAGFPIAIILSWAYDLTRGGIERTRALESTSESSRQSAAEKTGEQESLPEVLPDSLAVLPFENMSDDPEQEYFSDGLTEDIITDLSLIPGVFVIARNSAFSYKGKSVDIGRRGRGQGIFAEKRGVVLEKALKIDDKGASIRGSIKQIFRLIGKYAGPSITLLKPTTRPI
jgi:hypothetical protein